MKSFYVPKSCFFLIIIYLSGAQLRVHLNIQAGEHAQDYEQVGSLCATLALPTWNSAQLLNDCFI